MQAIITRITLDFDQGFNFHMPGEDAHPLLSLKPYNGKQSYLCLNLRKNMTHTVPLPHDEIRDMLISHDEAVWEGKGITFSKVSDTTVYLTLDLMGSEWTVMLDNHALLNALNLIGDL